MEAVSSSNTSVLTRATWRNIPEHGILHSHRRENLESYKLYIPTSYFSQSYFNVYLYLSVRLQWNQIHYYWGPLLLQFEVKRW
jgi:hypothetical protein